MTTGNHIKEIKIVIYYINFNLLTRLKSPLKHHSPKFPILTLPTCSPTLTPNTYPSANTSKLPSQMYFQNELLLPRQHLTPSLRTSLAPSTPNDPLQNITSYSQSSTPHYYKLSNQPNPSTKNPSTKNYNKL